MREALDRRQDMGYQKPKFEKVNEEAFCTKLHLQGEELWDLVDPEVTKEKREKEKADP